MYEYGVQLVSWELDFITFGLRDENSRANAILQANRKESFIPSSSTL